MARPLIYCLDYVPLWIILYSVQNPLLYKNVIVEKYKHNDAITKKYG